MILSKIWLPYFALATKSISLRTENDQLVLGPKTESKKKTQKIIITSLNIISPNNNANICNVSQSLKHGRKDILTYDE